MIKRLTLAALSALTLATTPLMASAQDATTPALQTRDSYLIVTRQDARKCAYPMCGGYFVKSVNQKLTRCADGTRQKECHAVQLNTNALGWTPEQHATFDAQFAQGKALVRGVLEPAPAGLYTADQLTITEAWQAQGGPCTMAPRDGMLVVRAPDFVHRQIEQPRPPRRAASKKPSAGESTKSP